jgi:hypothetical protein
MSTQKFLLSDVKPLWTVLKGKTADSKDDLGVVTHIALGEGFTISGLHGASLLTTEFELVDCIRLQQFARARCALLWVTNREKLRVDSSSAVLVDCSFWHRNGIPSITCKHNECTCGAETK